MTGFLLISQIVLVVVLTITVLLQKSSSIGLGAYSGSNESVFGAKGPGSFLAKTTFFLGFLFVVNTIALGYYYGQEHTQSVVDTLGVESAGMPAPSIPSTEEVPLSVSAPETTKGLEMSKETNQTASAPVTTEEIADIPTLPVSETNSSN